MPVILGPIRRLLPQSRFARRLTILSGGTTLGQAAVILVTPLLTRLYGPVEFGVFAVFSAVAAILCPIAALRFEVAVPVARRDEDAAAIALAGGAAAVLLGLLAAAAAALAAAPLSALLGIPGHGGVLWLMPAMLLSWGLSLVLAHWSIRRGTFRTNALGSVALSGGQAGGQLLLGWLSPTAAALVVGYVLGSCARLALLAGSLARPDRALWRRVPWRRVLAQAREHWRYPVYAGSSAVLQSASQMLPAVLIAILYGPAAAGWFGLGQRVTGMPTRLIGEAAAQAFLGEIAQAEGPAVYRLFQRTVLRFFLLGLLGLGPLLLAGPPLFGLVFGEPWRETGRIVQILVPLHLARFVVLPVAQTLNVTGRQHLHLAASLLGALALVASFAAAALLDLPLAGALLLYSLGTAAAFLFYLACVWRAAKAAARQPQGVPEPAGTEAG